jgi:hypothetical protein
MKCNLIMDLTFAPRQCVCVCVLRTVSNGFRDTRSDLLVNSSNVIRLSLLLKMYSSGLLAR